MAQTADMPILDENMAHYKATKANTVVTDLNRRLADGEAKLVYGDAHGYLESLLSALDIPVPSQILVASKSSANRPLISPQNPRAVYFNAQVSVAYVPSSEVLEVAAADPALGIVFYTLDQKPGDTPRLHRDDRCLECHVSSKTLDIPGLLVRSFLTEDSGRVDILSGIMVNHRTPIAERWGGYYVTGRHGVMRHYGNLFGEEDLTRHRKESTFNGNLTDLKPFLDVGKYPLPGSDIVSLLVLDHQVHMQNLLIRMAHDAGKALAEGESLEPAYPAFESTLQYMLFVGEAALADRVEGLSGFKEWFETQGPKDALGRSLTQFDLQTRLFKYPCSYMIYSSYFDALPTRVRRHFYHRLWEVLTMEDTSPEFKSLTPESRRAILEILKATKSNLPVYWRL